MFIITKEIAQYLLDQMINYDINKAVIDIGTDACNNITYIDFELRTNKDNSICEIISAEEI